MKYFIEFEIQMLLLNEGFKIFQNWILSTSGQLSVKHISELSCIGLKLHANVNTIFSFVKGKWQFSKCYNPLGQAWTFKLR